MVEIVYGDKHQWLRVVLFFVDTIVANDLIIILRKTICVVVL